jgi:Double zinc ribbon
MSDTFPIRDPEPFAFSEEMKLIPRWSVALAAIAFVAIEYLFWIVLPAHQHHPGGPPIGMRIYFALSWGSLAALYMLMIGYVSKDAPRRAMSMRFWMLICIVMPGGIGAVLYFMLRQPIVSRCPACGTDVQSDYHFCPQCAYQVSSACGNCHTSVNVTDLYCVRCGHDLAKDNVPARLRAFHN